jgi:hypothetical protein
VAERCMEHRIDRKPQSEWYAVCWTLKARRTAATPSLFSSKSAQWRITHVATQKTVTIKPGPGFKSVRWLRNVLLKKVHNFDAGEVLKPKTQTEQI